MRFWRITLLLAGTLFLASGGYLATAAEQPSPGKPYQAKVTSDGVQRAEIIGGSYFFTPNRIVVKVNIPVELKIRKEQGIVPHNIVAASPEAGIVFDATMGNEASLIRFTPTKVGSYPFYCNKKLLFFESHQEKGMKGILEVVE